MDAPFISQIIEKIVTFTAPEQIILFGSYARGDNRDASDIDLLIIKRQLKNEREMTNLLYRAFLEMEITVPVDLLAVDYDRYRRLQAIPGYIYRQIAREGKVLYGKS
ncbi:nucleotidyltransferase [Planctomycetales bacterium]|nr:nucleotidyltransferase [Planctomycetales bacterium]GHT04553.1 nucleotidyltransferase [Planctomycetales bacterium]